MCCRVRLCVRLCVFVCRFGKLVIDPEDATSSGGLPPHKPLEADRNEDALYLFTFGRCVCVYQCDLCVILCDCVFD